MLVPSPQGGVDGESQEKSLPARESPGSNLKATNRFDVAFIVICNSGRVPPSVTRHEPVPGGSYANVLFAKVTE